MMLRRTMVGALGAVLLAAAPAAAAPPNDTPLGAAGFQAVTAENGTPTERQGIAQLTDATADPGVPRCLGAGSFERTVWFRVESTTTPRRIKVDASGSTTSAPDLAAFVQPPTATDTAPAVSEPQACDGPGAIALEGTAVVDLHVPAGQQVLIQVGRRATQTPAQVLLDLDTTALPATAAPAGDRAADAPRIDVDRDAAVDLAGATLTEEDPAQPACPAAGTVWRRVDVPGGGRVRVTAAGAGVGTLTALAAGDALGCVNRGRGDALALDVTARAGEPLWLRLGADAIDAAPARLRVERAPGGGAGSAGSAGGPGGSGASTSCRGTTRAALRITGKSARTLRGTTKAPACGGKKVRRVELALQRRSGTKCQAVGTSGRPGRRRTCTKLTWVKAKGTSTWRVTTKRRLPAGRYVLRVRTRDTAGRASATTRTTFTVRAAKPRKRKS